MHKMPCACGSQCTALLECRGLNPMGKRVPVNCRPEVMIEWDLHGQLERDYLTLTLAFFFAVR